MKDLLREKDLVGVKAGMDGMGLYVVRPSTTSPFGRTDGPRRKKKGERMGRTCLALPWVGSTASQKEGGLKLRAMQDEEIQPLLPLSVPPIRNWLRKASVFLHCHEVSVLSPYLETERNKF